MRYRQTRGRIKRMRAEKEKVRRGEVGVAQAVKPAAPTQASAPVSKCRKKQHDAPALHCPGAQSHTPLLHWSQFARADSAAWHVPAGQEHSPCDVRASKRDASGLEVLDEEDTGVRGGNDPPNSKLIFSSVLLVKMIASCTHIQPPLAPPLRQTSLTPTLSAPALALLGVSAALAGVARRSGGRGGGGGGGGAGAVHAAEDGLGLLRGERGQRSATLRILVRGELAAIAARSSPNDVCRLTDMAVSESKTK